MTGDAPFVIFAADRRISRGGQSVGEAPKVFRSRDSQVGVGFFRLAEIGTSSQRRAMSSFLQDIVTTAPRNVSPQGFAALLLEALRAECTYSDALNEPCGFHVSGFSADGEAEFWYVRNIDDRGVPTRAGFDAREDFRARDRAKVAAGQYVIYRNGDIRAHIASWAAVDESLGRLLGSPSFRPLRTASDYELWVKTKMELIGSFYERFATEQIIGNSIDSFSISRIA